MLWCKTQFLFDDKKGFCIRCCLGVPNFCGKRGVRVFLFWRSVQKRKTHFCVFGRKVVSESNYFFFSCWIYFEPHCLHLEFNQINYWKRVNSLTPLEFWVCEPHKLKQHHLSQVLLVLQSHPVAFSRCRHVATRNARELPLVRRRNQNGGLIF